MKCPKCKALDTRVVDSRMADNGRSIRRRRECTACGSRFTTFERLEFVSFMVTKSSGELELYDRDKLEASIMKSLTKRTFDPKQLTDMINALEVQWAANKNAVTSKRIGRDILAKLREFDEIAFLRYASIYHNHESVSGFIEFLQNELKKS
ncbi:transcriptional regulator NrdR [Candidatus Gracilibacteria bacterium]|nr:transcriptional regulator NrdR [Candidatus Gracilibacteria bacterium]